MSNDTENTPLFQRTESDLTDIQRQQQERQQEQRQQRKKDQYSLIFVRIVLVALAIIIASILTRIPLAIFSAHPFFMTLFLILSTEATALLQPTRTKEEKHQGLKHHAVLQVLAFISATVGFTAIFCNKIISNKSHFTSGHGKLGVLVISYLAFQLLFGLVCAFAPDVSLSLKSLWKYHRWTGYVFLLLVWLTTTLGLQGDYIVANTWLIPPSFLLSNWIFFILFLVLSAIVIRIRVYKLKGQVITL